MIYIVGVAILLIVVLRWLSPRRYKVKASRPSATMHDFARKKDFFGFGSSDRWWTAGFAIDENGKPIDTSGKFVGTVSGRSMVSHELPDHSTFIADYLKPVEISHLAKGDVVVVRDRHSESDPSDVWQYCLRSIRTINGDTVDYEEDAKGAHDPHPIDQIVALVTRVIPAARPTPFRAFFRKVA